MGSPQPMTTARGLSPRIFWLSATRIGHYPSALGPAFAFRFEVGCWILENGRICGKSRSKTAPTCGSPDAGLPAPEPDPAAAGRRPICLREPAAWQRLWLIPPPLGRMVAIVRKLSRGSQAEKTARIAFTRGLGLGKSAFDDRKGFIRRRGLLAYHPKMGR